MFSVLSAQSIATRKVAVIVCNRNELKRQILLAPGSDNDIRKSHHDAERKIEWNNIMERTAAIILENLGLPKRLHEVVISTIFLVGIRMLHWAIYHERILSLEREYSVNFLNSSFFTQLGIINNKKAAEKLIVDQYLSIQQRYKLACVYCFTDHISELYTKMTSDEWEMFYNAQKPYKIDQPEIVKFWSYDEKDDIDKLIGEEDVFYYFLETAVDSGSQAAVEFFLENLKEHPDVLLDAAAEIVQVKTRNSLISREERYINNKWILVPEEYYIDILYSLLLKMTEGQKKEYLKNGVIYEFVDDFDVYEACYIALEYFLNWPYQDFFRGLAKLLLEISQDVNYVFTEKDYGDMLLNICDRIESRKESLKYGEEKTFSYRELLEEFWNLSPERFKRYAFRDADEHQYTSGVELLIKLHSLTHFTHEDKKFIKLLLTSATFSEKERIVFSLQWRRFCIELMEEGKWEILYRLELNTFLTKEKTETFKRDLSFTKEAQRAYIDFILNDKWDSVDFFISWSSLSDEEIKNLKKEIIHSEDGREACADILLKNEVAFDKFVRWCFPSEDEIKAFKKEFIFSSEHIFRCKTLVDRHQLEIFNDVINSCLSTEDDIRRLKKNVAFTEGLKVCELLITGDPKKYINIQGFATIRSSKYEGGKWKEVEEFLNWCFSSEEEKSEFKKNQLCKEVGKNIHFSLIKSKLWLEAEFFFAWVGLSADEIKQLKKETLFDYNPSFVMFRELMYMEYDKKNYTVSKHEEIDLFLKWYLTDKETVQEFNDIFHRWHCQEQNVLFEEFDLAIDYRLTDLGENDSV